MTRRAWTALALTLAISAASARTPEPDPGAPDPLAPVTGLAQKPPAEVAFAEARFSTLLSRPLVVSGQLSWEGGERLRRHVDMPYVETTLIDGGEVRMHRAGHGTREFSLDRAPPLKALLEGLVAVLSGDRARLAQAFDASRVDDGKGPVWSLALTPKSSRLSRRLSRIVLDGGPGGLRCMTIVEANGTASVDLLGALAARMPAQPSRDALTALCRHAGG